MLKKWLKCAIAKPLDQDIYLYIYIMRRLLQPRTTVWKFGGDRLDMSGLLPTPVVGLSVVILSEAFVMFE